MFLDQIVPVNSPGAGRSLDISWPDYFAVMPQNGGAVPTTRVPWGRQGANTPAAGVGNTQAQSNTGVGGTPGFFAATGTGWNGRGAIQLNPGNTFGLNTGVRLSLDAMTMFPNYGAAAVNGDRSATDDFACWRCFAIMSFPATNAYGSDLGIEWAASNVGNWQLVGGGACGFGFQQTAADTISFIRRPSIGGALTSTIVRQTSNVDLLSWNTYEVRVIGATPDHNAFLRVFINGTRVLSLDWVNDNLGAPLASNGVFGYTTGLHAFSGGVGSQGLVVNRVRFMAAPTEAALL
jgi:hypothetical protein